MNQVWENTWWCVLLEGARTCPLFPGLPHYTQETFSGVVQHGSLVLRHLYSFLIFWSASDWPETIIQFLTYRNLIWGCRYYQIRGKTKAYIFCVPTMSRFFWDEKRGKWCWKHLVPLPKNLKFARLSWSSLLTLQLAWEVPLCLGFVEARPGQRVLNT